uniref:CCHC-type domain-containing protein n=1 Tax=Cucumis melo TaxID=3656 RepID=A0A9I9EK71_CUCME
MSKCHSKLIVLELSQGGRRVLEQTSSAASPNTCYRCGEQGHFARGCAGSTKGKETLLDALGAISTACHKLISTVDLAMPNAIVNLVSSSCSKKAKKFRSNRCKGIDFSFGIQHMPHTGTFSWLYLDWNSVIVDDIVEKNEIIVGLLCQVCDLDGRLLDVNKMSSKGTKERMSRIQTSKKKKEGMKQHELATLGEQLEKLSAKFKAIEEQEVDHLEVVATELKEELNQISPFGTKAFRWSKFFLQETTVRLDVVNKVYAAKYYPIDFYVMVEGQRIYFNVKA